MYLSCLTCKFVNLFADTSYLSYIARMKTFRIISALLGEFLIIRESTSTIGKLKTFRSNLLTFRRIPYYPLSTCFDTRLFQCKCFMRDRTGGSKNSIWTSSAVGPESRYWFSCFESLLSVFLGSSLVLNWIFTLFDIFSWFVVLYLLPKPETPLLHVAKDRPQRTKNSLLYR